MNGACQICGEPGWLDQHHRKMRSQGGDETPVNIMYIDRICHAAIHADPHIAYEQGYLVKSWAEILPLEEQWHLEPEREQEPSPGGELPAPGCDCPTCHRRMPHPKKTTSPKTKTISYRVPIDDSETFHEMLEAAAENVGLRKEKHWAYNTLLRGLVLLLQEPRGD